MSVGDSICCMPDIWILISHSSNLSSIRILDMYLRDEERYARRKNKRFNLEKYSEKGIEKI